MRKEEEGENRLSTSSCGHGRKVPTLFKYLSVGSTGPDEAIGAQNSVEKEPHLGPSNEGERARETRDAHPPSPLLERWEC